MKHEGMIFGQYENLKPAGEWETVPWVWLRVALYIASAEMDDGGTTEEAASIGLRWFDMLCERKMVPGGQVIRGSAAPGNISLINCTHVHITDDSIEAIYKADYEIAKVESRGEGVGTDLTILRPKKAPVNNAARSTSGAISWGMRFDHTTGTVAQDGRRGALLMSLGIEHPESMDFIHIKSDLKLIENANISLRIRNTFMEAYEADQDWTFKWVSPDGKKTIVGETRPARDIMRELATFSAKFAEPGLQFLDTVHAYSNSDPFGFPVEGTNACSEQWLCHLDSCVLAHQNFGNLPDDLNAAIDEAKVRGYYVSWFCDNVVTKQINDYRSPLPESRSVSFNLRRIGAGWTCVADYFNRIGVEYGDEKSVTIMGLLAEAHNAGAYTRSIEAAELKGPFPAWVPDCDNSEFMKAHPEFRNKPRRNVCCTTTAPVGTGMILLQGDGNGIEPWLFFYGWRRTRVSGEWRWYFVVNKAVLNLIPEPERRFLEFKTAAANSDAITLEDRIIHEEDVIEYLHHYFPNGVKTCHNVDPMLKADVIAAAQKHIDSSISVTYNMPQSTTVEQIEQLYYKCWKIGLKGVAIYREDPDNREPIFQYERPTTYNYRGADTTSENERGFVPKRGAELSGKTVKVKADGYNFYFTLNTDEQSNLIEVFVSTNEQEPKLNTEAAQGAIVDLLAQAGVPAGVVNSQLRQSKRQAGYVRVARLISIALRCGVTADAIVEALNTIEVPVSSYVYQLRRILAQYTLDVTNITCPECKQPTLVVSANCKTCATCGYSKC